MKSVKNKTLRCLTWLGAVCGTLAPLSVHAGDEPFVGEIAWVAFDFEPRNWAFCDGRLLAISQNTALFSLLGIQYGGNGTTTFALPDLRGRGPIHSGTLSGNTYTLGDKGGAETHTLTVNELPAHSHVPQVDPREATVASPGNATGYLAKTSAGTSAYGSTANATLAPAAVGSTGGGQAHNNMKPYLALNCVIALQGYFPSRN
jgi:microcystin-dependent protein